MQQSMAVLAENPALNGTTPAKFQPNQLQQASAECYAAGFLRAKTAEILMQHFWPEEDWNPKLLRHIRMSVKKWEGHQGWRDLVYHLAVEKLDLETPAILAGVAGKAKKGDVPAAKFSLELAGRYQTKDQPVTAIQVNISGIPRPTAVGTTIEGEVVEEDE